MAQNQGSNSQEERRRSLTGLLFWLGLLPVILGSLFCCAQLALLYVPGHNWSADTRSRLAADYSPWEYQKIPALKLAELIKDIQRDEFQTGTPMAVVTAVYWVPPTPGSTPVSVAVVTNTPVTRATNTPEVPRATASPTGNPTTTATRLVISTNTPLPNPTSSLTPSRTPTQVQQQPSRTNTPQPQPPTNTPVTPSRTPVTPSRTPVTPSRTPVTPSATPVTPSATPVTPSSTPVTPSATPITPSPTFTPETPTPTFTPETPTFTPTYAPVRPIPENDGISTPVPGGCLASFGYRNDNPQVVHIDIGPLNQISDDTATITPFQPTDFLVGRITGAFQVFWTSGSPIIWSLDGRLASVEWCSSPTPTNP